LLGQNVNAYSHDQQKLSTLISELSEIKDIKRIRYSTSHPKDFTKDLIEAHKSTNKKLMPLIHLPVQSGSNNILQEMNRKHTVQDYLEIIDKLKAVNPKVKFSSDFIIGYPGETENDFNDTLNLLNKIEFINCFSFIFSPRPGTPAGKLTEIDYNVSKKRLTIFQKTAEKIKLKYKKSLFNKTTLVLFENKTKIKNEFFGRDEYWNPVIVKTKQNLKGKLREVKITGGNQNTLYGEIDEKLNERDFAA
jgi:radical SAM methylthiotransferase, MiaB/RimO family